MKYMKLTVLAIIFIFLFFTISTHVYAIDMYLTQNRLISFSNITSDNFEDEELETEKLDDDLDDSVENTNEVLTTGATETTTAPSPSRVITSREATSNDELSTSDIINIILIAVGIVIILLGVAILIRCK